MEYQALSKRDFFFLLLVRALKFCDFDHVYFLGWSSKRLAGSLIQHLHLTQMYDSKGNGSTALKRLMTEYRGEISFKH